MTPEQGRLLVALARESVWRAVGQATAATGDAPWLTEPGATFVTLHRGGRLRGCIGSIEPRRSIGEDVRENAVAAAMRDPRFWPMSADELFDLSVEVTVLSALEALVFDSEADALSRLRPHIDGVVLSSHGRKGTFLPQMWKQLPDPGDFIGHLKVKAGLKMNFWSDQLTLQRFTVEKWSS